jgi:hypothetical protein
MKKIITTFFICALSLNAYAATKCVPDRGGVCCWDTNEDGPYKPPIC